jgi:acetyl esterase/lipase
MNPFLPVLMALSIPAMALAQDGVAKPGARKQVTAALRAKEGVVYKSVGDVNLRVHLFFPKDHLATDTRPAAVFYFGGGWNGGSVDQFKPHARYLASRGMVAAVADYRVKQRHGTSPFACVADAKSAVRWLRSNATRLGIHPDRIAAGGGSAGGHVAATTGVVPGLEEKGEDQAVSTKANALLLFNPVFDNGPGGYGHQRVKKRYLEISPLHNIQKGAPPTIVFLGTKDTLIPVATAESYAAKMKAVGSRCDLHLYKGQPHGFFNERNNKHYYLTVVEMDRFLESLGWLQGEPTIKKPAAKKQSAGK